MGVPAGNLVGDRLGVRPAQVDVSVDVLGDKLVLEVRHDLSLRDIYFVVMLDFQFAQLCGLLFETGLSFAVQLREQYGVLMALCPL